ncbi:MAG: EAL domain-containing protein [Cyanobacteriota bacterium]
MTDSSSSCSAPGLSQEVRRRAEAMAACLKEPLQIDDLTIAVSLSIGITLVDPDERQVGALIQRSDQAMFQAKRSRNGRIIGPEDIIEIPQLSSYQLFTELLQAIREQSLQMHFQPICTSAGETIGFEALARWPHAERGMVPPQEFLELAEHLRQTHILGRELIRLSLAGFSRLQQRHPQLQLYLNLAPSQLLAPDLAGLLLRELEACGLRPSQLVLEFTEHSILEPLACVQSNLARLRGAGLRLALDDFGTGYSSLGLLSSLHPEVVKIDKAFTQALPTSGDAAHIVTLIADLAPRLGLELVAEGIEDWALLERLSTLGVGLFQGFALGAPAPLEHWLVSDQWDASSRSMV